ncbi:hypothetical protein DL95DRAFT_459197 [Leptodontidium sp. 2 PMI_412]|nr:hypothetical protein DL95DRAFT_459197 [Leptodontidium sp. 2 PMI_412]
MEQAVVNSAIALTAASFLIILSRTFLRRLKHEKSLPDDWLMLVSIIFYVVFTATYPIVVRTPGCGDTWKRSTRERSWLMGCEQVYNGINTTQTEPDKLTDDAVVRITLGSKLVLVGRVFYVTYLWCLKACILIYYTRLSVRTFELLLVKIVAGTVLATWILSIATLFLECRPIELYWQVLPDAPECAASKAVVEVIMMESLNISTDVFIMAVPIPLLLRACLSLKHKIEMSGLFLGGVFLIFISVLRMLIVLGDLTTQNKLVWAQIECFVATIVANAPVLHEMWRHGWGHMRKRRFGRDGCSPEYSLAIRAPTQSTGTRQPSRVPSRDESSDSEPENDLERRETSSVRGSKARLAIRKSVRKINNKLRKSLEQLEIETTVILVQHSKTGVMSPAEDTGAAGPSDGDFFSAPTHGKDGTARIRTEISCAQDVLGPNQVKGPKSHLTRFFRGNEGCG